MKINCLSCGHKLDLDEDVYADYEGQTKCYVCGTLLEIKMANGKLRSLQMSATHNAPPGKKAAGR